MIFAQNTADTKCFCVNGQPGQPWLPNAGIAAPQILLSKAGAGFVPPASGPFAAINVGNGLYRYPVTAADTNTLGALVWSFDFNDGSGQIGTFEDQVLASVPGGPGTLTNGEREAIAAVLLGYTDGVDINVSPAHALCAMAAVLAGKTIVSGDRVHFRNWQDTKDRVVVRSNVSGRYQVTFDFT